MYNSPAHTNRDSNLTVLLDKIGMFCSEFGSQSVDSPIDSLVKIQGVALIAEAYDKAYKLYSNAEEELKKYFGENTLRHCLEIISQIEKLQTDINANLGIIEGKSVIKKNLQEYYLANQYPNLEILNTSPLWVAEEGSLKGKYKTVFRNAHENLAEPEQLSSLSNDPIDKEYNQFVRANLLESHLAYKAKPLSYGNENIIDVLNHFQEIADDLSLNEILTDLCRCLELIRQIYMCYAQDIYFIRTGEYAQFMTEESKRTFEHRYSELPLSSYFVERHKIQEMIEEEELVSELDLWRTSKHYTNRQLLKKEYLEFLKDTQEQVLALMRDGYPELWNLREHSGSLDEDVTPMNFARMFYGRKDVDPQFLELEWKYELLSELIAKANLQNSKEPISFSPEQTAVKVFVDNLNMLADWLYENWNGKIVSLGAHLPDACIEIKRDKMSAYLQDLKENHFEDLQKWCYPQTSTTRQSFVKFVTILQNKGFFGVLPNNLIAPQLAPIVGLAVGTVNNYLSQK